MRELAERYGRQADYAEATTARKRTGARTPDKGWRTAICTAIALVLGVLTLGLFATHDVNQESQPSDQELTTSFFSHEEKFDELLQMLARDRPRLAAKGALAVDLATTARLDANGIRFGMYRGLLQQISVGDLRYFPGSGKLVLVPNGRRSLEPPSKSYLYLPHGQPQSLVPHYGYDWRGPGMYILTGDRPLKGGWYIHHDVTIEVAVPPY